MERGAAVVGVCGGGRGKAVCEEKGCEGGIVVSHGIEEKAIFGRDEVRVQEWGQERV